jgi:DUF4097 and DUF4098 domain-containing protein YvlB
MMKLSTLMMATPLLLAGAALASEPGKFDRTLAVTGPVNLDIQSGPGGINISVGTAESFVVHAVIRSTFGRVDLGSAEANIRALEQDPPVEQAGNTIRIGYVKDQALLRGVSVTYEVETPRASRVHATADAGGIRIVGVEGPVETVNEAGHSEVSGVRGGLRMTARAGGIVVRDAGAEVFVRNQSGGIEVQGVGGGVDAETTSGRIAISGVAGDVHADTHSASIRLDGVKGAVRAQNQSGSIEAFGSGGAVHAETASGSIRISQASAAPIRALSGSGAIHVELANGAGYMLDAQSVKGKISGRATESFPKVKDQRTLKGQIGLGGPLVDLDTRSSKIEID